MLISAVRSRGLAQSPRSGKAGLTTLVSSMIVTALGATQAVAKPIVYAQPFTARPGDVISVTGIGFGATPSVSLQVAKQNSTIALKPLSADDRNIVVQIPKDQPFAHYRVWVGNNSEWTSSGALNAPRAMHFDRTEIAGGERFRIYGRNLYLANAGSAVTFVDPKTGAELPATIRTTSSDAYVLDVTAPAGLTIGTAYQIRVSNGFDTANADETLRARGGGGTDYYKLGISWGADFYYKDGPGYQKGVAGTNENDHRVYDITNDPALKLHAKGDGATDATAAIQAAVDLVGNKGGGVVYFPAGTYRLASKPGLSLGVVLRSGVVLKGQSADTTKIIYGPTTQQDSSYQFYAFHWPNGTDRSGLADLSIQNIDRTSQNVTNAVINPGALVTRLFIQRVNWDLGSGKPIILQNADKIAIQNSTFTHYKNTHYPQGDGRSGIGPLVFMSLQNMLFRNNKITWETGQNLMNHIENVLIETNTFTRRATDQIVAGQEQTKWPNGGKSEPIRVGDVVQRSEGRQLSINFGKDIVIQYNTFKVADGTLRHNWHDGETILSEAGGPYPRGDTGTVSAASSTTISDYSHCSSSSCVWNLYPNSMVAIVSGRGTGQMRRIVGQSGGTLTIDKPWDIVPQSGDHFQTDVPQLENTMIRHNALSDNPVGIVLWGGNTLNLSIVRNNFTDNGGILLRTSQTYPQPFWYPTTAKFLFAVVRNIEINGNHLVNNKGKFPSYIANTFALADLFSFWGTAADTVEIRNNKIYAKPGTPRYLFSEGYFNNAEHHNPRGDFVQNDVSVLVGTVLQGNHCSNCPVNYTISTGVDNTAIWNATTYNSSGVTSQFVKDAIIWGTTTRASTGTVIGTD